MRLGKHHDAPYAALQTHDHIRSAVEHLGVAITYALQAEANGAAANTLRKASATLTEARVKCR